MGTADITGSVDTNEERLVDPFANAPGVHGPEDQAEEAEAEAEEEAEAEADDVEAEPEEAADPVAEALKGSVGDVLAFAEANPDLKASLLAGEKAGKKRKGVVEGLSG